MKNWHVVLLAASIMSGQILYAWAQPAPSQIPGCVYLSSPPTLTNLQTSPFLCDINGRLKVTTTP